MKEYTYKDPVGLGEKVITIMKIGLGLQLVAVVYGIWELYLLLQLSNEAEVSESVLTGCSSQQGMIGIGQVIMVIITAIFFARWIYRANANLHAFGIEELQFTPGWSIGCYFVPILNAYKPYKSMSEIWCNSLAEDPQDLKGTSSLLGRWWALIIVSSVLGQMSGKFQVRAESLEELQFASIITIIADVVDIPLIFLAGRLVRKISGAQSRKAADEGIEKQAEQDQVRSIPS